MGDLVVALASHCDMVIFDSPPILALADATLLMRLCDAIILVVLSEVTRADTLARVRNHIAQSGAHLTGTVLNKITSSTDGYYHYYYRKYYGNSKE
jgi:Mrp family chromosome partitioning ATPase